MFVRAYTWPFIFLLLILGGCTGTVEESESDFTKVEIPGVGNIKFTGIERAQAISDTKAELFFYPASGGSSKFVYQIELSNDQDPISVSSDLLTPDYRGLLRYTVSNLSRLTSYKVKVLARDQITGDLGSNDVQRNFSTFGHEVARFNGIVSASNLAGQNGKDSIKLRWMSADTSGGLTKQDWDPVAYEIVIIDSNKLTPGDMDTSGLGVSDGYWSFIVNHDDAINEYVARGLPSSTRFYARIRARHEKSVNDVYDRTKIGELNTKYTTITTLSDSLADIEFTTDSFAVSLPPGFQALSSANMRWDKAKGVFDHFRIYYTAAGAILDINNLSSLCLPPLLSNPGVTTFCKKAAPGDTTSSISGLEPYSNYQTTLVLCQTTSCGPLERIIGPVRDFITDPSLAKFNGVLSLDVAKSLDEVGRVKLNFEQPDFTNGYFDGLIIKVRRTIDGSDVAVEVTEVATNTIYHTNYDFLVQSSVDVFGINYMDTQPYCFTMHPYKFQADGVTKDEFPNDIWRCFQPKLDPPTSQEFLGLTQVSTNKGFVDLSWDPPTKGIFSHYELFWRKQSTSFLWSDATLAADNFDFSQYGRLLIDKEDVTNVTLPQLPDGDYVFGMITYYVYVTASGPVTFRSETNMKLFTCDIDNSDDDNVNCVPN